jgi:3',5'-cyclic-AMP phosphodiesterase
MIIAQITDMHIRAKGDLAYGRVDTAAYLATAVDHLNSLPTRPDVTLVSGDICDFGLAEEYAVAKSLLDRLAMPYFVIPGNHDRPDVMRQAFSDHEYLPDGEFLHYTIDDYTVRLIGLDTTVPEAEGGLICKARRHWLSHQLNEDRLKPTLLFMHHPPFLTGIQYMDAQNCGGADELGHLIAEHPQVQMILCGHVHRAISTVWYGTEVSIGPSPAHAVSLDFNPSKDVTFHMEPPACRLVHLSSEGQLVAHLSYIGDFDGPHRFRDDDDRLLQ